MRRTMGDDDFPSPEQPGIDGKRSGTKAKYGNCNHPRQSRRHRGLSEADVRTWEPRQHAGDTSCHAENGRESSQTAKKKQSTDRDGQPRDNRDEWPSVMPVLEGGRALNNQHYSGGGSQQQKACTGPAIGKRRE